jgi:hypothetical protein
MSNTGTYQGSKVRSKVGGSKVGGSKVGVPKVGGSKDGGHGGSGPKGSGRGGGGRRGRPVRMTDLLSEPMQQQVHENSIRYVRFSEYLAKVGCDFRGQQRFCENVANNMPTTIKVGVSYDKGFRWTIAGNTDIVYATEKALRDTLDVWVLSLNDGNSYRDANKELYDALKAFTEVTDSQKESPASAGPKAVKLDRKAKMGFAVLEVDADLVDDIDEQIHTVAATPVVEVHKLSKKQLKAKNREEESRSKNAWCDGGRSWGQ